MALEQLKVTLDHFHDGLLTLIYLRNQDHKTMIVGMLMLNQLKYPPAHPRMDPERKNIPLV